MFKKTLTSAVLAVPMLFSAAAMAGGVEAPMPPECQHCFKPFVGISYAYMSIDYNRVNENGTSALDGEYVTATIYGSLNKSFNGIGFDAGLKYGPYFGLAFGMDHYFSDNSTLSYTVASVDGTTQTTGTLSVSQQQDLYYMEARGYLPLTEGFDLIGSIGGDVLQHGTHATLAASTTTPAFSVRFLNNVVTWRFGLGADYFFTPNWGITAMFHYSPVSGSVNPNSFWNINAGIDYMFS